MNVSPKKKKIRLPGGRGLLTKTQFREVMEQLEKLLGFELEIPGISRVRQVGSSAVAVDLGSTASGSGGGASTTHPFYLAGTGLFVVGTVNGVIPLVSGEPIGAAGTALSLTGYTGYAYLIYKWSVDESYGTVVSWEPLTGYTPVIALYATPQTDVLTGAEFHSKKLIAEIVDGVVQHLQPTLSNLSVTLCSIGGAVTTSWSTAS